MRELRFGEVKLFDQYPSHVINIPFFPPHNTMALYKQLIRVDHLASAVP